MKLLKLIKPKLLQYCAEFLQSIIVVKFVKLVYDLLRLHSIVKSNFIGQ